MHQPLLTLATTTLKSHYPLEAIKGHASYECTFLGYAPTHLLL